MSRKTLQVASGDRFLLYTDGVLEADKARRRIR